METCWLKKEKSSVVDDELVYKDIKNKRSGYDIVNGTKILNTERFESFNVGGRGIEKRKLNGDQIPHNTNTFNHKRMWR